MILFPDIQARAQAELDAVVGTDRLPTFDDRKSLPYIEALMREVLRWHPPPPLGQSSALIRVIASLLYDLQVSHTPLRQTMFIMDITSRKVVPIILS